MTWNDDSWRYGYDAWKLASPYDEYPEECFHEDYEADFNGRAHCCRCPYSWWLSPEEIENERQLQADYDQIMRREERRARITELVLRLAFWRRWRKPDPVVDDVPF